MNTPADFYVYQGEGNQAVLGTLRACRKMATAQQGGQKVIMVAIEPAIPAGTLPAGVRTDVIGLSQHGAKPLEHLKAGDIGSALLWEVYDFGGGKLGVAVAPTIGRGTIYRIKPALDSKGNIMAAPAAARAVVGSIIRALEQGGTGKR